MPDLIRVEDGVERKYCKEDCAKMRDAMKNYGVTDTGPDDLYVIDDDPNWTQVENVLINIRARLRDNPEKKHLIVLIATGHGMIN